MDNPYVRCSIFHTQNFILRLISEKDAKDLLACYSDPKSQEYFNVDNFPHDCRFNTVDEMINCIKFWLMEYSQEAYVRFCIVDKSMNKAIGTIEMFGMIGKYKTDPGILRVDIASNYENINYLSELFSVCVENFYELFKVNTIATKAIAKANDRVTILKKLGFCSSNFHDRPDYYLRSIDGVTAYNM